jgi:serine/threonine-protein kinase RsbW
MLVTTPAAHPFTLLVSGDRDSLPLVRSELRRWLERTPASDEETEAIVLASWEACVNALEHPIAPLNATISLDVAAIGRTICVAVRDSGLWLQRRPRPGRGLGLRLIDDLMDRVEITRNGAGTVILMCRRLAADGISREL